MAPVDERVSRSDLVFHGTLLRKVRNNFSFTEYLFEIKKIWKSDKEIATNQIRIRTGPTTFNVPLSSSEMTVTLSGKEYLIFAILKDGHYFAPLCSGAFDQRISPKTFSDDLTKLDAIFDKSKREDASGTSSSKPEK